ncbi:MAG: hypothetical protein GKR89_15795 [Candidatus Latescibacteria bacterium]|nr:hypothetical protein [Candidatus Latescibacterota bacterium]
MATLGVKQGYRVWGLAVAVVFLASGGPVRAAQVQEQVPIPGLTVEESVRLESASDKLKELAVQRQKKNDVRRDEIEKLIGQVEEAAKSQDDLRYRAARERLISYIFAANDKDHADLSQIVYTVKETWVLSAKARIAIEQLGEENQEEDGLGGLLEESQAQFQEAFVAPNQREIVLVSTLLSNGGLSVEEEQRLNQYLGQLVTFNSLIEEWEQPLEEIPYLPTQIDPAFDNQEAVVFLDSLSRHLRFDYKDLEIQLFWSEILAQIGYRYAEGKLPLVRVQSALNRLSRLSGDWPRVEGKPWFMGALGQLASVEPPKPQQSPWRVPKRETTSEDWLGRGKKTAGAASSHDPQALLRQIHSERKSDGEGD